MSRTAGFSKKKKVGITRKKELEKIAALIGFYVIAINSCKKLKVKLYF